MLLTDAFKLRPSDSHKGNYGHVLVLGGDIGMPGAARMAAEAAARVGAGLVTVATQTDHVAIILAGRPELMVYPIKKVSELALLIQKATVLVVGPGLSPTSTWSKKLTQQALKSSLPMVVDAGALALLADQPSRNHWILTPHPGEAAHLLQTTADKIQSNRLKAAKALQQRYGGTIVLKGHGTIIQSKNDPPVICTEGNPGMATGGMGDVLSGVIAGLVAQGLDLPTAAATGVFLHARAGDLAAKAGERGMLASDLMPYLRELVNPERS